MLGLGGVLEGSEGRKGGKKGRMEFLKVCLLVAEWVLGLIRQLIE